ncbi:MAG: hypothetical protein K5905_25675 [Roseibium sp.]|uniref:hypothetical protein n=1 Tax=Roseibium sp. TaxID=1936156 RepID=UPI00260DAEB3|nr:hypothetical protein [Roseibium sp.]MCV0428859.1 hypothetical protein [Roseibium sp.]
MTYRERIAYAIFSSEFAPHVAGKNSLKNLPSLQTLLGEDEPVDPYLSEDWELNKSDYFKHADAALNELKTIAAEQGRPLT